MEIVKFGIMFVYIKYIIFLVEISIIGVLNEWGLWIGWKIFISF